MAISMSPHGFTGVAGPYPVSHIGAATARGLSAEQPALSSRVMPVVSYPGVPVVASPVAAPIAEAAKATPLLGSRPTVAVVPPLLGSRQSLGGGQANPVLAMQAPLTMGSRQGSVASLASNQSRLHGAAMTPMAQGGGSLHAAPGGSSVQVAAPLFHQPPTPTGSSRNVPIATAVPMPVISHQGLPAQVAPQNGALDQRLGQLTKDLEASRASEARLAQELKAAKDEIDRLASALTAEKQAREQAEAALAHAEVAVSNGAAQKRPPTRRDPQDRQRLKSPTAASQSQRGDSGDVAPFARPLDQPRPASKGPRRGSSPGSSRRSARDEVDVKLNDYLAASPYCKLEFRRLNRGWYEFRHIEDVDAPTQCVEMSMVNGKLMVKLEPTSHDPGWNNGKVGPIDRFVMNFS